MKKARISLPLVFLVTMLISVCAYAEAPDIRLNNYVIPFGEDQAAEIIDGELYIPVRKKEESRL